MGPAVDPFSKATALAELLAKAIEELRSMKPQEKPKADPKSNTEKGSRQLQPHDEKSKFNPRGTSPFVIVQSGLTTFFDEPSDNGEASEAGEESSQRRSSFSRYDTTDSEDENWKPKPRETSQRVTFAPGTFDETELSDRSDEEGNERLRKRHALTHPDLSTLTQTSNPLKVVRTVQRNLDFIPDILYELEEKHQLLLAEQYGVDPVKPPSYKSLVDASSDSEDEESSRGDIIPEMPKLSNCEDEAIVLRNVKPEIPELSISEDEASSPRNANSETREIPETEDEATDLAPSIRFGRKHSKVEVKGTKVRKTAQEYYERTDEERAQAAREARIADAENNAPDRTSHPKVEYGPNRTEIEVMGSKGPEITREFYKATNEEITKAAKECRRMIAHVTKEEQPKKDRIWQEVYKWAKENGIKNDSPYKTYLMHEWSEKKYTREYLRRRLAEVPVEVPQDPDLSIEYLLRTPPR